MCHPVLLTKLYPTFEAGRLRVSCQGLRSRLLIIDELGEHPKSGLHTSAPNFAMGSLASKIVISDDIPTSAGTTGRTTVSWTTKMTMAMPAASA